MSESILKQNLEFPVIVDIGAVTQIRDIKDFLVKTLDRNPMTRLGTKGKQFSFYSSRSSSNPQLSLCFLSDYRWLCATL